MLGLLLLYFIGKKFSELAKDYNKKTWVYILLGIVSYYLGTFVGGIVLVIVLDMFFSIAIEEIDDFVIGLMAMPFGLLMCWGYYRLLVRNWSKQKPILSSDILDDDFLN
ncbi:MAG: hypothetical protein AB8F74_22110 [Saprospiraceae bacterium]